MEIWYIPSLSICSMRMFLLLVYLFLLLIPVGSATVRLSHGSGAHLSNATDQEAMLGFVSAIRTYDTSQPLPTSWKPNVSVCEWTNIICSGHRVVSLNVSSMGLEEYGLGGQVTTKSEVYSYGIVLLEMLTKKKPTHNLFTEGMDLKTWTSSGFPNQLEEVVDSSLLNNSATTKTEEDKTLMCLGQLIRVGLSCTQQAPRKRPNMMDIVGALESIRDTFLDSQRSNFSQISLQRLLSSSNLTSGAGTSTTSSNVGNSESSIF